MASHIKALSAIDALSRRDRNQGRLGHSVRRRRVRYSESPFRPLCPRVSFWTRRRTSSRRWLASRITCNRSATWRAFGSTLSSAVRYGPDMSNTAQRIPASHSAGRDRNQEAALSAVLLGTMSINCRPPSTTAVHQNLVRHRPCRQNNVTSTPLPQLGPRLSDQCRLPAVLCPSGRPRC